jgi:hypothetical protein
MKLISLNLGGSQVRDLTPLQGMPLKSLHLDACSQVQDLTPLGDMALEEFSFPAMNITKGIEGIRRMKSLKKIGLISWELLPAEEFWKKYDAGELK